MNAVEQVREARRKLEAYLSTGIEGFKVQGLDRLRALNFNLEPGDDIRHLADHLRGWGY